MFVCEQDDKKDEKCEQSEEEEDLPGKHDFACSKGSVQKAQQIG